jgi:hypothetical protein
VCVCVCVCVCVFARACEPIVVRDEIVSCLTGLGPLWLMMSAPNPLERRPPLAIKIPWPVERDDNAPEPGQPIGGQLGACRSSEPCQNADKPKQIASTQRQ